MPQDSTGRVINVGDRVRFRGDNYTIKSFGPTIGAMGTYVIEFVESYDGKYGTPDEISVDRIEKETPDGN